MTEDTGQVSGEYRKWLLKLKEVCEAYKSNKSMGYYPWIYENYQWFIPRYDKVTKLQSCTTMLCLHKFNLPWAGLLPILTLLKPYNTEVPFYHLLASDFHDKIKADYERGEINKNEFESTVGRILIKDL